MVVKWDVGGIYDQDGFALHSSTQSGSRNTIDSWLDWQFCQNQYISTAVGIPLNFPLVP